MIADAPTVWVNPAERSPHKVRLISGDDGRWADSSSFDNSLSYETESIATVSQSKEHPAWSKAIDALLAVRGNKSRAQEFEAPPNNLAIDRAIFFVNTLRETCPWAPPTLITHEPAGGIIVERREGTSAVELIFYNNAAIETTIFENGKVKSMSTIRPSLDVQESETFTSETY